VDIARGRIADLAMTLAKLFASESLPNSKMNVLAVLTLLCQGIL
jgi:hypothetical protein